MKKRLPLVLCFITILLLPFYAAPSYLYAQSTEETAEQRGSRIEDKKEDLLEKPETPAEILRMIRERAEVKIEEKRKQLLWKTKTAAGLKFGFETNPLNDQAEKGDWFVEEELTFNWVPTFTEHLGADVGYRVTNQSYMEQTDLDTFDNDFTASLKYYPFESHELFLQPGATYEWLAYPRDELATYEDTKAFLKFKHYIATDWYYGGKYEYSHKGYDNKLARDINKNSLSEIQRKDHRNTVELYVTRNISKYSLRLKAKAYRNNSNDEYQAYYDYYSYRGYLTLSGSFLKDDRLYVSFTPDYEIKSYDRRVAVDTARWDNVLNYKLDAYYTVAKDLEIAYTYSYKNSVSNAEAGEFLDITNSLGMTYRF